MTQDMSRYVQIDDWIFEVKMVRALRVDSYGKPYSAISNININGDSGYIDGLLTSEGDDFTKEDYDTFVKFCQKIGLKEMKYDRYKNKRKREVTCDLTKLADEAPAPALKLVL